MTSTITYFDLEIKKIVQENSVIKTLVFSKPEGFNNRPGQFCWLSLPELREETKSVPRTPMAVASGMSEKDLIFSFRNWGGLTQLFFEKKVGDIISVSQPLGSSVPIDLFESNTTICIAGGTGIVPIRSLVNSIGSNNHLKILYGARTPSELLYKNEIGNWDSEIIVERPEEGGEWKGQLGFVTKLLTQSIHERYKYCYICGPYPMMKNTVSSLKNLGFAQENIYVSLEKVENNEVVGPVFPLTDHNVNLE